MLRTSRFFPEGDDDPRRSQGLADDNLKALEYLHRRVAIEDAVDAHLRAVEAAPRLGFDRFVVSAPTPFVPDDVAALRGDLAGVLDRRVPGAMDRLGSLGWRVPAGIDRVYDSSRAQRVLGWSPVWDFSAILDRASAGHGVVTPLQAAVGAKGYHPGGLVDTACTGPADGSFSPPVWSRGGAFHARGRAPRPTAAPKRPALPHPPTTGRRRTR